MFLQTMILKLTQTTGKGQEMPGVQRQSAV